MRIYEDSRTEYIDPAINAYGRGDAIRGEAIWSQAPWNNVPAERANSHVPMIETPISGDAALREFGRHGLEMSANRVNIWKVK